MTQTIGLRKEDKNRWERRAPVVPGDVAALVRDEGLSFAVQSSPLRAFDDEAYREAGAEVRDDLAGVPVVLGVKEMPLPTFEPGGTYVFFSHTIKGQPENMPMFRRLVELGCTLIDYERITDDQGRRLVFFGKWAGTAGMLDALWALGRRLAHEGVPTPLAALEPTVAYDGLAAAQDAVARAGARIAQDGLPDGLAPLVVGFLGYGNVSRGAQEIIEGLPCEEVRPGDLEALAAEAKPARDRVYKAVFREEDLVEPRREGAAFSLEDYYTYPEKYRSTFRRHLPRLSVIMNCVYWDRRYPRFVLQDDLAALFAEPGRPRLRVIGDISCDLHGAVEVCVRATEPDSPVYVFDPRNGETRDGVEGPGVVVLAVDNLPCELPRESSADFSAAIRPFLPALAAQDFSVPWEDLRLPAPLRRAVILHRGRITDPFRYMQRFLKGGDDG